MTNREQITITYITIYETSDTAMYKTSCEKMSDHNIWEWPLSEIS